ncbi:MAG: hypothetical protein ACYT04_83065, partial [Nostoc sp.]
SRFGVSVSPPKNPLFSRTSDTPIPQTLNPKSLIQYGHVQTLEQTHSGHVLTPDVCDVSIVCLPDTNNKSANK